MDWRFPSIHSFVKTFHGFVSVVARGVEWSLKKMMDLVKCYVIVEISARNKGPRISGLAKHDKNMSWAYPADYQCVNWLHSTLIFNVYKVQTTSYIFQIQPIHLSLEEGGPHPMSSRSRLEFHCFMQESPNKKVCSLGGPSSPPLDLACNTPT